MVNDDKLEELIRRSGSEKPEADQPSEVEKPARFNQGPTVLVSWMLFAVVLWSVTEMPADEGQGVRGVEKQLSIAMYHAAHHVESYRHRAGKLPQFLHPSWHESAEVEFLVKGEDYELIGRYQDFELRFQRGDDAELLLHGSTWGRSR